MKDKKFIERLNIMHNSGKPFLAFLRNLTPKILFATLSILAFNNVNKGVVVGMFLGFFTLFIFLIAFVINTKILYLNGFNRVPRWGRRVRRLVFNQQTSFFQKMISFLYAVYKKRLIELIEFIMLAIFIVLALPITVAMGGHSAVAIISG